VIELVVDARIMVYRVTAGIGRVDELPKLDARLQSATTLIAPSCEFLRSYRMIQTLSARGFISPVDATRLSMLVCESGVELRPLWPWDVPRIASLPCHPSDAWCVAIAESLDAPLVTTNPALANLGASCRIEVY
jgi:hypothetical protein